jgi:hypothetical protein
MGWGEIHSVPSPSRLTPHHVTNPSCWQKRLSKVIPGDYQVQVHIIEGRNFTPQDSSGTSDPFVYVKCNVGEAQRTKTQKKTNSPWFDEVLVFNFGNLSREALQEATVTIAVYDEDWFGLAKQMIGSYSFDLLSVYTKNDEHELRRVWVGLTDTEENNEEVAAQGFLKISCTVIGPNDPLPLNNPEQDAKDEAEREKVTWVERWM